MNFEKIKKLFVEPSAFFNSVSKEKNYWDVLKVFVVIYIGALIIQTLIGSFANRSLLGAQFNSTIVMSLILGVIAAFLTPFIGSLVSHLGILIIGGKKGFFNTFKALTFGGIVILPYGVVNSIISGIMLKTSGVESAITTGVIVGIISIIGFIHTLVVQTIGVSKFQSISSGKAFFGIILIPLIVLIFLVAMGSISLLSFVS